MNYVPVGRIVSARGIKGETKLRYYNEEKEAFSGYTSFFVKHGSGWRKLEPAGLRLHKGFFYVTFRGLEGPEDTSFLANEELFVREEDLPQLEENEYYEYQLLGLAVIDRNGVALGDVAEIVHTGANDVLVVRGEKETLVPMTEEYILSIDINGKAITAVEPEV